MRRLCWHTAASGDVDRPHVETYRPKPLTASIAVLQLYFCTLLLDFHVNPPDQLANLGYRIVFELSTGLLSTRPLEHSKTIANERMPVAGMRHRRRTPTATQGVEQRMQGGIRAELG